MTRAAFNEFVARTREQAALRHPHEVQPFVFAAFHPAATADTSRSDRLVPFLRRTPDPTIQLLRSDLVLRDGTRCVDARRFMESIERPPPRVRERIAEQNLATVHRVGLTILEDVFTNICRDRQRTYDALLRLEGSH